MSWWGYLWLCILTAMLSSWVFSPPIPSGGLLLWYIYDMFPVEKPLWFVTSLETWFVKHPKEQYVTLHGSVFAKAVVDIVENVREGWTDEQVQEAVNGLFVTAHKAGGTIDDVDHLVILLTSEHGSPPGTTQH